MRRVQALNRSLAIAEERGDPLDQVRLLGPLNMFHLRTGNFATALEFARRCSATAASLEDSVAIALAHSILGISLHLRGDLAEARAELEAALDRGPRSQRTTTIYLGFEGKILARAILARNLWLQGHPDQAMAQARQAVEEAAAMDHSLTLAIALIWAISVFLWTGDLKSAEAYIDMLIARAESHSHDSLPAGRSRVQKRSRDPSRRCKRRRRGPADFSSEAPRGALRIAHDSRSTSRLSGD